MPYAGPFRGMWQGVRMRLEEVWFRYGRRDGWALSGVNAVVEPGQAANGGLDGRGRRRVRLAAPYPHVSAADPGTEAAP